MQKLLVLVMHHGSRPTSSETPQHLNQEEAVLCTHSWLLLWSRFLLQEDIEGDLCSEDPWLVLHKIDSPTKMRFVGNKVSQCDPANFTTTKVAASLAHNIGPEGQTSACYGEGEVGEGRGEEGCVACLLRTTPTMLYSDPTSQPG